MFDSTPPNLPVEPSAQPAPKPVPQAAPVVPPSPAQKAGKEPEDIFSGLDTVAEQRAANAGVMGAMPSGASRAPIIIIGVISAVFILGGIGYAVWAFVLQPKAEIQVPVTQNTNTQTQEEEQMQQIEQPPVMEQQLDAQIPANIPLPGSVAVDATGAGTVPEPQPVIVEPVIPVEAMDTDRDLLSDAEELLLGTDIRIEDTDGDGFTDAAEVTNMYDPTQRGVSLTKHPGIAAKQWNLSSFLAPSAWTVTATPDDPSAGVITTTGMSRFTLEARPNASGQSLENWVGSASAGMKAFKTKNGLNALQSADGLTTYLSYENTIIIVGYDLNGDAAYEFRTLYRMIIESFQRIK